MKLPRFSRASSFAVAVASLIGVHTVYAANSSWNVDASGNWADANWSSGVPGATSGTTSTDIATFGNTLSAVRTVTVSTDQNIGGITFSNTSTNGFTLSGGNLLLSSGGTIQTASGNGIHSDTISSPIQIQGNAGLGSITANATDANSFLSIGGTVSGVSGSTTTLTLNGSNTGSNVITGAIGNETGGNILAVTKTDAGNWNLGGANNYSGATNVNGGSLTVLTANGLGNATGATTVTSGSLVLFNTSMTIPSEALTLSGTGLSNGGALVNTSTGTNTWGGTVTLAGHTRINSTSGTLDLSNTGTAIGGGNYNLTLGGSGNIQIESVISTGSGTLTKDGSGTVTLSNSNGYTGGTTVTNGVLNIRTNTALGTTAVGTTVSTGAALELQNGITVGAESLTIGGVGVGSAGALRNVSGDNSYGGLLTLTDNSRINSDSGTLTLSYNGTAIVGANFGLTVGGAGDTLMQSRINATTASLTKDGTGTLTLTYLNSYTGATTISGGNLSISTIADHGSGATFNSNLGRAESNSSTLLVFDGGTLQYTGSTGSTNRGFSVTAGKTATIEVSQGSTQLTISGSSSATTGGLTKTGPGTLTLTGANLHQGTNTISGGILQLGNGGTAGSLVQSYSRVYDVDLEEYVNTNLPLVNNGNLTLNRSNTITQGTDFSSVISGTGSVTQAGGGTTTLSGTNTYTGTTKVNAGVLNVTGSLASGSAVTVGGDGSSGTPTLAGNGTINGATTIAAAGTGVVGIHAPTLKQTFGSSLTYNTDSIFEWDLASSAQGSRGITYDAVNVGAISGSGAVFKVILGSGNFSEGFWNSNQTWSDIFKTADGGAAVSIASTFASANIQWFTGSTNMTAATGGEGYFTTSGTNLNWTAVPEPSSALAGLLLGAGLLRRRRK